MDSSTNELKYKERSKQIYRSSLNYEDAVLLTKIRDISLWRDTNIKAYESGVLTLAMLLPKDLRKAAFDWWGNDSQHEDLSKDGKIDFDDLLIYILEMLEDHNICFPKVRFHEGIL